MIKLLAGYPHIRAFSMLGLLAAGRSEIGPGVFENPFQFGGGTFRAPERRHQPGARYVHAAISNGPDIDGVYGRYVVSE